MLARILAGLCGILPLTFVTAQSESNCTSEPSSYQLNNITVSFTNFCGKDIEADVNFPKPQGRFSVNTFEDCLDACVGYHPICYGFVITPSKGDGSTNCWLKNRPFLADAAKTQDYLADSAMLDFDNLPSLDDDCQSLAPQTSTNETTYTIHCGNDIASGNIVSLPTRSMADCLRLCDTTPFCVAVAYESSYFHGIYNCYLKNAEHGDPYERDYSTINAAIRATATSSSVGVAATTTTNITSPPSSASSSPTSSASSSSSSSNSNTSDVNGNFSTGAKAGIGVGVALGVIIAASIAAWLLVKRRRQRQSNNRGAELPIKSERSLPHELDARPPFARLELDSKAG